LFCSKTSVVTKFIFLSLLISNATSLHIKS
jgi:hypothetical protein